MDDTADAIAKALERREKAQSKKTTDDRKAQEKLIKKIAKASVVKLSPFWWLPAILRSKVTLQKKNAELSKAITAYEEFGKRQSVDMKKLFQLCIKYVPEDYPGWKDFRQALDPQNVHGRL